MGEDGGGAQSLLVEGWLAPLFACTMHSLSSLFSMAGMQHLFFMLPGLKPWFSCAVLLLMNVGGMEGGSLVCNQSGMQPVGETTRQKFGWHGERLLRRNKYDDWMMRRNLVHLRLNLIYVYVGRYRSWWCSRQWWWTKTQKVFLEKRKRYARSAEWFLVMNILDDVDDNDWYLRPHICNAIRISGTVICVFIVLLNNYLSSVVRLLSCKVFVTLHLFEWWVLPASYQNSDIVSAALLAYILCRASCSISEPLNTRRERGNGNQDGSCKNMFNFMQRNLSEKKTLIWQILHQISLSFPSNTTSCIRTSHVQAIHEDWQIIITTYSIMMMCIW